MTSCKEINVPEKEQKRTKFQVEIDISNHSGKHRRKAMCEYLRADCFNDWMDELADIIEKG